MSIVAKDRCQNRSNALFGKHSEIKQKQTTTVQWCSLAA